MRREVCCAPVVLGFQVFFCLLWRRFVQDFLRLCLICGTQESIGQSNSNERHYELCECELWNAPCLIVYIQGRTTSHCCYCYCYILLLMFCDCDRCDVYFKSVCEYADIVNAACGMHCRQCDTAGAGLCDDGQCYSFYTMANDKTCHGQTAMLIPFSLSAG